MADEVNPLTDGQKSGNSQPKPQVTDGDQAPKKKRKRRKKPKKAPQADVKVELTQSVPVTEPAPKKKKKKKPKQPKQGVKPPIDQPIDQQSPFAEPAPFDIDPAQPLEPNVEPSPFDGGFQPVQQPAVEQSPFDATPQPYQQQPVAEPAPFEQQQPFQPVEPSPFDAGFQPVQQPAVEQSPFDATPQPYQQQPVADPFAAYDTQAFAQQSQPAMTGDPMKDIPIFPDNFGSEPEPQPVEPPVETQPEPQPIEPQPAEPAKDDFFGTMGYGNSPFDAPPSETTEPAPVPVQPEAIEAEVVSSSSEVVPEEDKNQFALPGDKAANQKGFWATLQESGVSKRFVFGACGLLILLVAVITFLSWGGLSKIQDWFSSDTPTQEEPTDQPPQGQEGEGEGEGDGESLPAISNAGVLGQNAGSKSSVTLPVPLRMAQLFGREFSPLPSNYWRAAIENATALGAPSLKDRLEGDYRVVTALDLLRRMVNAYQVDIHSMLDRAVSREQALDDYLQLLNELYEEAKEMRAMLTQELSVIRTSFEALTGPKEEVENIFFSNIEELVAADAAKNLRSFIEYSQELVSLRARYKALQRIDEKFVNFLQQFRARLQDLQDNRDALLKGVKVYDVPRSDLDLIIPVELKDLDQI